MTRLSFRKRLSLWHTAAVACFLAIAAFAGHWALARLVLGQLDAALVALAETEGSALESDPRHPVRVHEFAPGSAPPSFVRLDRFVQIVDLDGNVLAKSANLSTARLPAPQGMLERLKAGEVVFETFEDFGEEPIRVAALPINAAGGSYAVLVSGSLDDAYRILNAGRWLFLGVSLVLLAGVAVTTAVFARRALQPVDEIVAQARRIGESNLAERLPQPTSQDELGRLIDTLNAMLARVERGVETQRRFTADASHELRSPLSRLRAEIEVTLRRPRDPAEYEETLRSCLEEVERLSELTEELLTLAHLDAEERPGRDAVAVPLLPIVHDALRRLGPQAHRRAVRLLVGPTAPPLAVRVAPTAVGLALTNILDNAVKFSPVDGEVRVGVSTDGGEALIIVSDQGPGVVPDELPRLFDRFHRGAAARASEAPGFGLGLAISRAVIERQGGSISADSAPDGGARFRIRLPLAD
jgi:two-component system, OmpR family, sensor kinase